MQHYFDEHNTAAHLQHQDKLQTHTYIISFTKWVVYLKKNPNKTVVKATKPFKLVASQKPQKYLYKLTQLIAKHECEL